MKEENIILTKSYNFGLRILKLYLHLRKNKVDVEANVEEAVGGSSRKDFINKLQIACRESRETRYWSNSSKDENNFYFLFFIF